MSAFSSTGRSAISAQALMTIQEDFEGFSVADFDCCVPILKKPQQTTGLAIR